MPQAKHNELNTNHSFQTRFIILSYYCLTQSENPFYPIQNVKLDEMDSCSFNKWVFITAIRFSNYYCFTYTTGQKIGIIKGVLHP